MGVAGGLDEATDGDEGGGEVEVEVHDGAVSVGAATEFAVVVHPRVRALDNPAFADLNGTGDSLLGDLADHLGAARTSRLGWPS